MPLIVGTEDYDLWLDPEVGRSDLLRPLLRPYSEEGMSAYEVSRVVNNPSHDSPRWVESFAGGTPLHSS